MYWRSLSNTLVLSRFVLIFLFLKNSGTKTPVRKLLEGTFKDIRTATTNPLSIRRNTDIGNFSFSFELQIFRRKRIERPKSQFSYFKSYLTQSLGIKFLFHIL